MVVLIILHGKSRQKSNISKAVIDLERSNHKIELAITFHPDHAKELAVGAKNANLIISCGGDGTHNAVVNGVMASDTTSRPMLSFIAAGSGNDLSRSLPTKPLKAIIAKAETSQFASIDIGYYKTPKTSGYFINMCTLGIGAEIARTVNRRRFRIPPSVNYYSAILYWLTRYKSPELSFSNGDNLVQKSFLVAIGNGKYAGNGLGLCPQAQPDDGKLAITRIGDVGVTDFLRYQSHLMKCQPIPDQRVNYDEAIELTINVQSGTLPIETDGEYIAKLLPGEQLSLGILPRALKVI